MFILQTAQGVKLCGNPRSDEATVRQMAPMDGALAIFWVEDAALAAIDNGALTINGDELVGNDSIPMERIV